MFKQCLRIVLNNARTFSFTKLNTILVNNEIYYVFKVLQIRDSKCGRNMSTGQKKNSTFDSRVNFAIEFYLEHTISTRGNNFFNKL